jgi:general secretion pathway protein N
MRWAAPLIGSSTFAAALIASLIVLAPATLIDARLALISAGRLRLAEAQGSLWAGEGWIEIRDADGKAGVAKRIAWRVLPRSFLRGRLVAEVELDQAVKPFPVTLSLSRIEILDAGITLPAAALGLGMPKLAPFRLTGDMLVKIPRLSLERGRMDGDATLQWRAAGSALTPISPLGDYQVQFKAAGRAMQAALSTLEGPLQLDGKGAWSNGSPPNFLATARVPAQLQEQLSPIFRLIAIERGPGTFDLQLK